MGPNFLHNIEGGEQLKDKSYVWRSALAIFLLGLVAGSFLLRENLLSASGNPMIRKVIEPIGQIKNSVEQRGGDMVVEPPAPPRPKLPELKGEILPTENFSAHSVIVKDRETGMVLYKKNEYDSWPMASITKLMSALVILEKNPDWTTSTTVIGADSLDTHMYAGDVYTLEELWNAGLIASSNKAILSLANALGWPEEAFVDRMNTKAIELGMLDTSFTDASGLDDTNLSTASDIVMLLNEVMRHEKISQTLLVPEYNLYSKERKQSHHMWNTDWLLLGWVTHDFSKFHGGKTGYIAAAQYNFTMRVENETGHILDVVILGADGHESRFTEARDVAEWSFDNYEWPE